MSLGLNTNYNPTLNLRAIDSAAIREVTQQVFNKEEAKTVDVTKMDLSKFNRIDTTSDLYNGKTNIEVARQISVRNAGLDVSVNQTAIANVAYLNAQAAQSIHTNLFKNVEGKVAIAVSEGSNDSAREVFALPKAAQLFNIAELSKDKRGSNPFSYKAPANAKKAESTDEKGLNIFA